MAESSIVNELHQAEQEVTIDKWVYGGDALARLKGEREGETGGRVVLAPFVLPGEIARLQLSGDVHAKLLAVTAAAPERITPVCPLFGQCGGCHYQHAPYEFQVARKVEILREQLRRVGKIHYEGEIQTISGPPLAYRNRAQLHLQNGRIGFLAPRSHTLVPLEAECPISSPRLNQAIAEMRARMSDAKFPRFVRALEIFTNETDVQINVLEADRPVARSFYEWCQSVVALEYATTHGAFRVSPQSFFQVNRFLVEQLVNEAVREYAGESALDLYAGVGLFAVPLAKKFKSVTAVESGIGAARDLEVNAERAGVSVATQRARVEDFLRTCTATPDFVLADPPRAGLGKAGATHLERLAPPRLTIVSCDPATLARDLAALPNYQIERITMVDLFPQTYHLETVVHLRHSSVTL